MSRPHPTKLDNLLENADNQNWRNRRNHNNPRNQRNDNPRGPETNRNNQRQPQRHQQSRGDGENRRSNTRDNRGNRYFNLRRLNELSQTDCDEVVTILAQRKAEFEELLRSDNSQDIIVATLRVLTSVCRANFTEIVTGVLGHACSANFLKSLEVYLMKLGYETQIDEIKNQLYHKDKNRFWSDLIEFFKKLIELLPTRARDELTGILEKIPLISEYIETKQGYKLDEKVKNDALNMAKDLGEEIQKVKEKNKASVTRPKEPEIEGEPPENFRSLSVIPTIEDLYAQKPFYRAAKIKDPYNSVEHYLDVQFRLLREDFVYPLRSGIEEYLRGPQNFRNEELRIYKKVTFIAPKVTKNNVGIMMNFGIIKNLNWSRSKRFIFGGLLLLSSDNFKTILFVTVAERDEKQLEKGYVLIRPCEGTTITRDMYNTEFVMLESKIYFEPYLAVLTAMQYMHEQNFPMTNYLIHADISTQLPRYLVHGGLLTYKGFQLRIGDDHLWPSAGALKLDETQYNAFKSALTEEFAVIQGPPGTGKTFIALEIVSTLLENKQHWAKHGPIVIVCLTNHALDQFLEGILKYTKSIVRVGSRSKNEALKPYTLMERRKLGQYNKRNGATQVMHEIKRELEGLLTTMEKVRLVVKHLTTPNAIVPLNCLTEYCKDMELTKKKSNEDLVNWLTGNKITLFLDNTASSQESEDLTESNEDDDHDMDNELELEYESQEKATCKPTFPLESIDAQFGKIREQIHEYRNLDPGIVMRPSNPVKKLEQELGVLNELRGFLERELGGHPILNEQQRYQSHNLRWRFYWNWVKISYDNAMNKLTDLEATHRTVRSRLDEAKQLVDLAVLKEHKIVGLTTTGAAKLHVSLRALRAPIVLVEEAAEILETHVVCSLTQHCQHTILIGDHKQLRPKPSVYHLGTKYNLNISLFERMVNIRGNCTQLAHQHRMRPQIAKLITPSIYQTLYNHESVLSYPNVKGLEKNLFFLNHNNRETNHKNEDSWVNQHEAQFLVEFAKHLIMQGYNATEITILSYYLGQQFAITKEIGRYPALKQVRLTTVDNYQGEENRIILLSMVRNNGEGNIGFLKEENRVCVALSRAREGLYVMGNMADLVVKNNIWPKIKQVLENENAIGDALQLRCQVHCDQSIWIKEVSDFLQQCPEGGCQRKCHADLSCGHSCTSICHVLDREHKEHQCKQPCLKTCPYEHPCPLKCWQDCEPCREMVDRRLKCEHIVAMACSTNPATFSCQVKVPVVLPNCNHDVKKPCYLSIEKCKCPHPCKNRLPCGHTCRLTCHVTEDPDHLEYKCFKDCTKNNLSCERNHPCKKRCHEECGPCPIIVEKTRSCGHHYKKMQCAVDVEKEVCKRDCKRKMNCGHPCQLECWETCGNCQVKVKKMSSCGHSVEVKCCEVAAPSKCKGECQKMLACGHPCTARCKDPCIKNCNTMVRMNRPGLCGHISAVPCHVLMSQSKPQELLKYCQEPCEAQLACEHLCGGKCGSCKQGRIHIPCVEPCGNILVCGHKCDVPCRQECQPCNKPCELQCRHSKCSEKCGVPCTPCNELCEWGCEHRKCTKRCSELCNIEPCTEPCKKLLSCDHPCVGFCGDPCPPLCRICDEEELTQIIFGDEDEPDARFVLLEDCNHCIESDALSKWITESSESIQMKSCPRCKTPIRKCMRLMNQMKKDLQDVIGVKQKVFGKPDELKNKQDQHLQTLRAMLTNPKVTEFTDLNIFLQNLLDRGIPVRNQRKQTLSSQEVEAYRVLLDIFKQILDTLALIKKFTPESYQLVRNQVAMLVESLPIRGQISNQELIDINLELQRLDYMVEMCKIDAQQNAARFVGVNRRDYDVVVAKLVHNGRFTENIKAEVRNGIHGIQNYESLLKDRQMIVKAMGFRQGHWYKCPNGHIYAIANCGGAVHESKCNECGASIGGSQHRLRADNALATEMDGATHSAWPGRLH